MSDKEAGVAILQPGLLEPCELKGARTVLRGAGTGDSLRLPDKLGRDVALAIAGCGSGIRARLSQEEGLHLLPLEVVMLRIVFFLTLAVFVLSCSHQGEGCQIAFIGEPLFVIEYPDTKYSSGLF